MSTPSEAVQDPAAGGGSLTPQTGASLRLLWSTSAQGSKVRLALVLTMPVLTILAGQFAGPAVIAVMLERIQAGTITLDNAWGLVWAYAITQLFGHVIGWRIALWAHWTMVLGGMRRLYRRSFDHLTDQSMAFHADRFGGSLVSQVNKLTNAYDVFWETIIWQILPVLTTVVAATVILWFVMWQYALFLAFMSLLFALTVFLSTRTMEPLNVREAQASTAMTGFLADVMTNIAAVKAQGSEATERQGARDVSGRWVRADLRIMRAFLVYSTVFSSIIAVTNVGAVIAAVLAADADTVDIAGIYLALTYTIVVTSSLWEITQIMRNYNKVMGDAHDMVEILGLPPAVPDHTTAPFRPGPGAVVFDRVGFAHDGDRGDPLFEDFSLSIRAGEKIGLVGHSGSGKSTLVRLLLRFSDVDSGSIRIDGQDVRDVNQASLRRAIAYVAQEPLLFHRTLRDNIAYGRQDATDAEIREAAAKAEALEFIERLPDGFQTQVGERGVKLSGGQRQRIAIARAVLKDAPLLVLDEATSALDSESEVHIQSALAEAMRGRTTLVIAHRLSTVQQMDRIIVLAQGRIVEQGSHAELLSRGGAYAGLWAHQTGGYMQ